MYCVVPASSIAGHGAGGAPRGIDGGHVRHIIVGDLAALVSTLDQSSYAGDAASKHAADVEWLAPRAVVHDAVVTWASDAGAVVPLPMWVMFADSEGVAAMLDARAQALQQGLYFVRDAREYAVRVTADQHALAEAAGSLDPTLLALAQQADAAAPGQAYLLRRKLASARKASVRDVAGDIADDVHQKLTSTARASALRRESGVVEGATAEPNVVLDAAYLVPDDRYDDFRSALTALIHQYEPVGCRFDFTGPWPPYHFVRGNE